MGKVVVDWVKFNIIVGLGIGFIIVYVLEFIGDCLKKGELENVVGIFIFF